MISGIHNHLFPSFSQILGIARLYLCAAALGAILFVFVAMSIAEPVTIAVTGGGLLGVAILFRDRFPAWLRWLKDSIQNNCQPLGSTLDETAKNNPLSEGAIEEDLGFDPLFKERALNEKAESKKLQQVTSHLKNLENKVKALPSRTVDEPDQERYLLYQEATNLLKDAMTSAELFEKFGSNVEFQKKDNFRTIFESAFSVTDELSREFQFHLRPNVFGTKSDFIRQLWPAIAKPIFIGNKELSRFQQTLRNATLHEHAKNYLVLYDILSNYAMKIDLTELWQRQLKTSAIEEIYELISKTLQNSK